MIETTLPLARELWATGSAPDPAALLEQKAPLRQENAALRAENAALRAENAVLHERVQELEARLGQNSYNSSRPPSSDPPQAPAKRPPPPSGRRRGSQPGYSDTFRALLAVEQVDVIVTLVPEQCRRGARAALARTAKRAADLRSGYWRW